MGDSDQTNADEEQTEKKPFKTIKFGANRIVKIAIPHHLSCLDNHCANIEKFKDEENFVLLHQEQINASNAVRSLKNDIRELEDLSAQVKEEDQRNFFEIIRTPIDQVVDKLTTFLASNSDLMVPLPELDNNTTSLTEDIPRLVCDPAKIYSETSQNTYSETHILGQLQAYKEPLPYLNHWERIKKEIIELNSLFKSFANSVFSQREHVNTIENHAQQATDNVLAGTKHLKKAVALKFALLPFAGAAVGGLLGPVGAAAGFHLGGSVACALGGTVLGFGIGYKIKKKRIASDDMEMKAITDSSKCLSHSMPDLERTSDDFANITETKKDI